MSSERYFRRRRRQVTQSSLSFFLQRIRAFFRKLFGKHLPVKRVVLLGISGAGKTSLCQNLQFLDPTLGSRPNSMTQGGMALLMKEPEPTKGLDYAQARVGKRTVELVDMSGAEAFQALWPTYIADAACIVFVIDASDFAKMDAAGRALLRYVVLHSDAVGKPVLLVANKMNNEITQNEAEIEAWLLGLCERPRLRSMTKRRAVSDFGSGDPGLTDSELDRDRQSSVHHRRARSVSVTVDGAATASNERSLYTIGMNNRIRQNALAWFRKGDWDVLESDCRGGEGVGKVLQWIKDNTSKHRLRRVMKLKRVKVTKITTLLEESEEELEQESSLRVDRSQEISRPFSERLSSQSSTHSSIPVDKEHRYESLEDNSVSASAGGWRRRFSTKI